MAPIFDTSARAEVTPRASLERPGASEPMGDEGPPFRRRPRNEAGERREGVQPIAKPAGGTEGRHKRGDRSPRTVSPPSQEQGLKSAPDDRRRCETRQVAPMEDVHGMTGASDGITRTGGTPMLNETETAQADVVTSLLRDVLGTTPTAVVETVVPWVPNDSHGVRAGCNHIFRQALELYDVMREEKVSRIRLRTERDAQDAKFPNARTANLALFMAWSLLAEDGVEVEILPALTSMDDEADLIAAARAYLVGAADRTDEEYWVAWEAFTDLCGGDHVHVDFLSRDRKASRLVKAAVRDRRQSQGETD